VLSGSIKNQGFVPAILLGPFFHLIGILADGRSYFIPASQPIAGLANVDDRHVGISEKAFNLMNGNAMHPKTIG
jgi:hypothetical protein